MSKIIENIGVNQGLLRRIRERRRVRRKRGLTFKVKKLSKDVKMLVASELNRIDITPYSGTVQLGTTVLNFVYLSGTAEGDASTNRNGLAARALRIKGKIVMNKVLDTVVGTAVRLILLRWNQVEDGSVPIQSDLFETASTLSTLEWDSRGKYSIVFDKLIQLGTINSGSSTYQMIYNYKVPSKHQLLTYDGSGGLIADAQRNHYFALAYASDGTDVGIVWQNRMIFNP